MQRTAEKILSIISIVFTVIAIIGNFLLVGFVKMMNTEPFRKEFIIELEADPMFTAEDIDMTLWFFEIFEGISWFTIIVLVISLIATIVGIVFMWNNKDPKVAGIMFIVAGVFAFIITPTSIMLYIAAILCFTRKPPMLENEHSFSDMNHDDSMRPL